MMQEGFFLCKDTFFNMAETCLDDNNYRFTVSQGKEVDCGVGDISQLESVSAVTQGPRVTTCLCSGIISAPGQPRGMEDHDGSWGLGLLPP